MLLDYVKAMPLSIALLSFYSMADDISPSVLSLEQAVQFAQSNDPWLHGNKLQQSAEKAKSIAAGTWQDPKLSFGLLNLPTDTANFSQEAMTQLKVGISQQLPRGDELLIKRKQLETSASKFPLLRSQRKAQLKVWVTQLWLDAFLAKKKISYLIENQKLFNQLVELAEARYSSGIGNTRQQEVISVQLELLQLEDQLVMEQQNYSVALSKLSQWLYTYDANEQPNYIEFDDGLLSFTISNEAPKLQLSNVKFNALQQLTNTQWLARISKHPQVLAVDVEQHVAKHDEMLAKQQYKPQWHINAGYAYRDNNQFGESRADLFSVGLSVDLPIFTENRQDKNLHASVAKTQSIKTEKLLLLKQMLTNVKSELKQLKHLNDRKKLYSTKLLSQSTQQYQAAMTAYTHYDGTISEVLRSKSDELDHNIKALEIDINLQKAMTRLHYYFTRAELKPSTLLGTH